MDGITSPRSRRPHSMAYLLMMRFALCMIVLLVLSLPVLYFITTRYYAEDLTDIVEQYGVPRSEIDLKEDTLTGMFIQFFSIIVLMSVAVFIVMRYVPQRLWRPFRRTMESMKEFRLERGNVPRLTGTGVSEFDELNTILTQLMENSVRSYRLQKEFTGNASHELQTPLAIAQMRIEAMQQDEGLSEKQAEGLQEIYVQLRRMSGLSRNLLLLSRIEGSQYQRGDLVDIGALVERMLPSWRAVGEDRVITFTREGAAEKVRCNEALMESLLTNLVVNAIRHSEGGGTITVKLTARTLSVSNEATDGALDGEHIFQRFYHSGGSGKGYGLGLAIVRSICEFHNWQITYSYSGGQHHFTVSGLEAGQP